MTATPFMQLYVADYMGDTQHLTTEQHGAYLLLLMTMWRHGGRLPNDASKLARIARVNLRRWHSVSPEVMAFFTVEGDAITQKRLSEEYQKATSISEKRSASGKAGGEAKALKSKQQGLANAIVLPQHSQIPDTRSKKETPTALPPPTDLYAFQGQTIRLTSRHLEQWRQAFPHITLESELLALDEWAGDQGGSWFHAVASALAKKERTARERINIRKTELEAGPPKKAAGDGRI